MSLNLLYHLVAIVVAELVLVDIAWRWLKQYRGQGRLAFGIAIIAVCGIGVAIAASLVLL